MHSLISSLRFDDPLDIDRISDQLSATEAFALADADRKHPYQSAEWLKARVLILEASVFAHRLAVENYRAAKADADKAAEAVSSTAETAAPSVNAADERPAPARSINDIWNAKLAGVRRRWPRP